MIVLGPNVLRSMVLLLVATLMIACTHLPTIAPAASSLPQFETGPFFDEQIRWQQLPVGVRVFFDAPQKINQALPTRLIIYALPNGNSIEETLGAKMAAGMHARFDIQHIAAQARLLRKVNADENVVLVLVEADGKAWPAWRAKRPDNARLITAIFDNIRNEVAASMPPPLRVSLMAHSGGGSFIFGLMNNGDLPAIIDRIVFLDANYGFDSAMQHGDRFLRWLREDRSRQLVVVAYDDREILFDGKRVVGPTGGTWRASGRMIDDFSKQVTLTTSRGEDFDVITGPTRAADALPLRGSQISFYLHRNPQNKILHTRLVGEMNGFLMAATLGTRIEHSWGTFGGPRAYGAYVQPQPFVFTPVVAP